MHISKMDNIEELIQDKQLIFTLAFNKISLSKIVGLR